MITGNFPSLFSLRSAKLYKDVGRHKARPLQLLVIEKNDYMELPPGLFSLRSANLYKDVGRHKARPLQLLVIDKNDYMELPQYVLASLGQRFYLIIMIPTQL